MDQTLGQELIKRNIIKQDTEVSAWYSSTAFGGIGTVDHVGNFTISSIDVNQNTFHARSNVDGEWQDITFDKVVSIDGMEPSKLAEAYGIKKKTKKVKTKK
jgi:hypothetical protein|tara:strand:+ start:1015 stop:1317 length:303 start_codon:yes stop_codon:yes gene_type:complete